MPAYKDDNKKTWTEKFKYKNWMGETKYICKRGFQTKREAVEWETNFKLEKADDVNITFEDFVNRYKDDMYPRIKQSTSITKDNIINNRILPYFAKKIVTEITTTDVIRWQNEMIRFVDPKTGKHFSKSYLKTLHNQLSAIMNYGVRFFGFKENPAAKVGNMGSEKEIELNFWTKEEYLSFSEEIMDEPIAYYCFETLYWTGMREGELLALNLSDIDFEKMTISISKTFHRIKGKDVITSPKTYKSNRVISIPEFLRDELKEYCEMIYSPKEKERLFPVNKWYLSKHLTKGAERVGLKHIRVHDLRHSHVSLLIDMGYSAVAIANRLGHESIEITYRYAHLFPDVQKQMSEKLNELR